MKEYKFTFRISRDSNIGKIARFLTFTKIGPTNKDPSPLWAIGRKLENLDRKIPCQA